MPDNVEQTPEQTAQGTTKQSETASTDRQTVTETSQQQQAPTIEDRVAAVEKAMNENANLRSVLGRQGYELGQLRQKVGSYERILAQSGQESAETTTTGQPADINAGFGSSVPDPTREFQQDLLFDSSVDDAKTRYNRTLEFVSDPMKQGELGNILRMYRLDGTNQVACLHAIDRELERRELLDLKRKMDANSNNLEQRKQQQKADAVVSGSATGPIPESIDLDDPSLTAEKMLEMGLVSYDPKDPPQAIRDGTVKIRR